MRNNGLTVTDTGFYNGNDTNAVTLIESTSMNSLNGNSQSDYVASTRKPANQDDMNTIDMGNGAQISINNLSDAEEITAIDISAASSIVSTNGNKYEVADYANNSSIEFPQDEQDKQHLMTHIKITNESGPAANYQAQIVASNTQYTPGSTIPWSAVVQDSDVISLNPGQSTEIQFSWDLTQYNNRKYVYLAISSSKASGGSPVTDSSEDRHGGTYETATNIYAPPVISGIKGRVHTSNDIDMLKFTALNTSPHTLVNTYTSTVRMAVYSEYDLNNPFTDRIMSPGDSWTFGSTAGETYYIKIYSYEGWIGNYKFAIVDGVSGKIEAQPIEFQQNGNNQYYIFSDNPEKVRPCDLLDPSNGLPPTALLHQNDLGPGTYYLFAYHHKNENYFGSTPVYFDTVFYNSPGRGGDVKINRIGYETYSTYNNWDHLHDAWDAFQYQYNGSFKTNYIADDPLWISTITGNYNSMSNNTNYGFAYLLIEFEVLNGYVNLSTVAFKNRNIAKQNFGSYGNGIESAFELTDLMLKGKSNTSRIISTPEMSYVIDDSSVQKELPVIVSNLHYTNKQGMFTTNSTPNDANTRWRTVGRIYLDMC